MNMTPAEILDYLRTRGVSITALQPHKLSVTGPIDALTPTLLARLKANEALLARYCYDHEDSGIRELRKGQERLGALLERAHGKGVIEGECTRVRLVDGQGGAP